MRINGRFVTVACCVLAVAAARGQQLQLRDPFAGPDVAGTATIAGVVVTAGVERTPLRRAIVTVTSDRLRTSRSAIADEHGAFAIHDLPAGAVNVSAVKAGYVPGAYGSTRPGGPGTSIQLAVNQIASIEISMTRGAAVAGRIRDARGAPVPDARVWAVSEADRDAAPIRPWETVSTDDHGDYRIYGLAPGSFIIAVAPITRELGVTPAGIARRTAADVDAVLERLRQNHAPRSSDVTRPDAPALLAPPAVAVSPAPIYFPGTAILASATPVVLRAGEERADLDVVVTTVPRVRIKGSVLGDVVSQVELTITTGVPRFLGLDANPRLTVPPGPDGRFEYSAVVPGHYTIMARAQQMLDGVRLTAFAVGELDVAGTTDESVSLRLERGDRFAGRIVFDSASPIAPIASGQVKIMLVPIGIGVIGDSAGTLLGNHFTHSQSATLQPDGTFAIADIAPGRYRIHCTLPSKSGASWWLRSAIVRGRDIMEDALDASLGADLSDATLTVTDRHSQLIGHLQSADNLPAPQYTVIVFSTDRQFWVADGRRVKVIRPSSDGQFSVLDLPAGDYFVAALTDVEPDDWHSPDFLGQLSAAAVRTTVVDGRQTTVNLRARSK